MDIPKTQFLKHIPLKVNIKLKFSIKIQLKWNYFLGIHIQPCLLIGDAYYHLGEFEKSLMFYYRALHKCQSGSECEEIRYKIYWLITVNQNKINSNSNNL